MGGTLVFVDEKPAINGTAVGDANLVSYKHIGNCR